MLSSRLTKANNILYVFFIILVHWFQLLVKSCVHVVNSWVYLKWKILLLLNNISFFFLKVCLEKLNDIQLALVIARLYESEFDKSATYKSILRKKVLGIVSPDELNSLNINLHYDPFLRSMAYWILEDYGSALETLIKQPVREDDGKLRF